MPRDGRQQRSDSRQLRRGAPAALAPYGSSQMAFVQTCIYQAPPLCQLPCWEARDTQSHCGDLIEGGKHTKPKVNKQNDGCSAMKVTRVSWQREGICFRQRGRGKPEALTFKLRLLECEKWGCGPQGRGHE